MSRHVPGPYTARLGESYTIRAADGSRLASMNFLDGRGRRNADAVAATCQLFAAAPETAAERDRLKEVNADLLKALKGLHKLVEQNAPLDTSDEMEAAERAILKAEANPETLRSGTMPLRHPIAPTTCPECNSIYTVPKHGSIYSPWPQRGDPHDWLCQCGHQWNDAGQGGSASGEDTSEPPQC